MVRRQRAGGRGAALARCLLLAVGCGAALVLVACGGAGPRSAGPAGEGAPGTRRVSSRPVPSRPGTRPFALEFLRAYENRRDAIYFPLEGLAAVAWGQDGSLILCDEARGRVFGFDHERQSWYAFEFPGARPFRPVDVQVDGFKVLVLDAGTRLLYRYELGGALTDRLVNFRSADPAYDTLPSAFDVDIDGRLVVTDIGEDQIVLFDPFLAPTQRLGEPGSHPEQFTRPGGVVFLGDGGFMVADSGNMRLQRYNRLGFFEAEVGGRFALDNPLRAPTGLDADRFGNLFVADPVAGTVHVLGADGAFIALAADELPLAALPQSPVDVAVGPEDRLAVADRGREAVLVFRILYE